MTVPESAQSARLQSSPGFPAGVTEAMIQALVRTFYGKAREDPLLGPIFEAAVEHWEQHLEKLCDFWSSVMLMSGRYHGTPMQAHARLSGLGDEHFVRWLQLFRDTAAAVCPPEAEALFVDRAERIAQSLRIGIAVARGEPPPIDEWSA
jgi:hemoglobin